MTQHSPRTAVIILNWNGAGLLREFLPSVVRHTPPALGTVIVADNGSTDTSLQVLREEFPGVRVMAFDTNLGFAAGYNKAIGQVRDEFEYTVLLNSDVAVRDNWLQPLVEFMDTHPRCGGCQPKILSYREPDKFEYAGAAGGFIDRNGYPYCRGRVFDVCEPDTGQYDQPVQVDWATGAALMMRTATYLEAGGLDPEFFAHMEEIDLCWRVRLMGLELWGVPGSRVYHLGGGSLPASNPRKTYLNFRNNLLLLHKNLPRDVRRGKLFKRRLLDTLAWGKFVATLDWKNAGAVWRAHRHYKRMARQYDTDPGCDLLNGNGQPKRPNILTNFYLHGRKKYSQLR